MYRPAAVHKDMFTVPVCEKTEKFSLKSRPPTFLLVGYQLLCVSRTGTADIPPTHLRYYITIILKIIASSSSSVANKQQPIPSLLYLFDTTHNRSVYCFFQIDS